MGTASRRRRRERVSTSEGRRRASSRSRRAVPCSEEATRLAASTPRRVPLHRDAPLPSTSSTDRIYAFDPWTKVPVILRRRPSHDHDDDDDDDRAPPASRPHPSVVLARGRSQLVGRVLLPRRDPSASPRARSPSCFARVVDDRDAYLALEVTPYVVGGVAFLVASCLLVFTSYHARYGEPGRAARRRVATRHARAGHVGREWQLRAAVGEHARGGRGRTRRGRR